MESAVNWVKENPKEAALLSAQAMQSDPAEVEFFLRRAALDFKKSADMEQELKIYLDVLKKEDVLKGEDVKNTLGLFAW